MSRQRYPGPPPGAKLLDSGSTNESFKVMYVDEVTHISPEQWAALFKRYSRKRRATYIKVDYRR